jgi:hypothetical protein
MTTARFAIRKAARETHVFRQGGTTEPGTVAQSTPAEARR